MLFIRRIGTKPLAEFGVELFDLRSCLPLKDENKENDGKERIEFPWTIGWALEQKCKQDYGENSESRKEGERKTKKKS